MNKRFFTITPLKIISLLFTMAIVTAFAHPFNKGETVNSESGIVAIKDSITDESTTSEESKTAFLKAYTVFMNPRCMNCHPAGDVPLQGDESKLHLQNVTRGVAGKGVYAMKCKNCHQDANLVGLNMPPGSPNWSMPPANRKMVFQGMSAHQLALNFKNNNFTGFKTMADMIKHVEKEPLVLKGWDHGAGLSNLPMSHDEFVASVKEWISKGAVVPE